MTRKAVPTVVAVVAFLAALTFSFVRGGEESTPSADEPSATAAAVRTADTATAQVATATEDAPQTATADSGTVGTVAAGSAVDGVGATTATVQGTTQPAVQPQAAAPASTPTAAASPIEGYRLRVPSLSVNASMTDLGVDAEGAMQVPQQAQLVAWYRFTSLPGQPGNSLLGGHITWRGANAVFRALESMSPGDTFYIDTPSGGTLEYRVEETWWAEPYTASDVRRVIGSREGRETVTLFTCGGTWDSADREYSHRRVVTAVRVV